jgi:hypothetical protein
MTSEEIDAVKVEMSRLISEQTLKFVGRPMSDVAVNALKGALRSVLKDLQARGVWEVDVLDFDVTVNGSVVNFRPVPKKGMSEIDYRRAWDFIRGRGQEVDGVWPPLDDGPENQ